ncbi:MAG: hypothetical protein HQL08_08635 [Nitrospirae bacterium]|nr:hypothetical protein [Nitrospirota bacterium]
MENRKNSSKFRDFYQSSGARKTIILLLSGVWLACFLNHDRIEWRSFLVLAGFILLYLFEILYSITTSTKTSVFLKSFIFQTAVPVVALIIVCVMAILDKIQGTSIVTLFGLSLAYTTYVVGRRIKGEHVEGPEEEKDLVEKEDNSA